MTDFEELLNNREAYIAEGIGSFTVDDVVYKDYSDYVFVWEKTYVKQPERSQNGSMGNLDTYATFITPRMKVVFKPMPIDVYRTFIKQYLEKNEFTVTCYDTVNDEMITKKMYFATPAEPTYIYRYDDEKKVAIVAVDNYTVELIGTNNED